MTPASLTIAALSALAGAVAAAALIVRGRGAERGALRAKRSDRLSMENHDAQFVCEWCNAPLHKLRGQRQKQNGEIIALGYCDKCKTETWSKPILPPEHPAPAAGEKP